MDACAYCRGGTYRAHVASSNSYDTKLHHTRQDVSHYLPAPRTSKEGKSKTGESFCVIKEDA